MVEEFAANNSDWDRLALDRAAVIAEKCTECGVCQARCAFLTRYGTPGALCGSANSHSVETTAMPYLCSLCGLCKAVCPEKLDPGAWFLTLRRAAVSAGRTNLSQYRTIVGYEKRGTSALFTYYGLPDGCDTVFFPGCTLPGTRPDTTWMLFRHLKSSLPSLGIVLDCCTKPSHDLGRQHFFLAMFGEMIGYLKSHGVCRVWVACPNCYRIFSDYASGIKVESVYEVVDRTGLPSESVQRRRQGDEQRELVIHDPCPMREENAVHESVRSLLKKCGIRVGIMAFQRRKTLCCGEGGAVGFVDSELAANWTAARKKSAKGRTIVTYCAGCAGYLGRKSAAVHLVDLLLYKEKTLAGRISLAKAPFTYLHRLLFKRKLKRTMRPAISRVRRFFAQ